MQPAPPPGWYRDPRSRYRLRWWDGRAWTGRTGLDPRWSITLLWAGLAIPAWLGAALLSLFTAEGISETPQVDQAAWVALVSGLAVLPIVGAAFGWIVAFVVTRRLQPAITVAGVTLLCMSVLLAFLVVPKAP